MREEAIVSVEAAAAGWVEEVPVADNPAKQLASELDPTGNRDLWRGNPLRDGPPLEDPV